MVGAHVNMLALAKRVPTVEVCGGVVRVLTEEVPGSKNSRRHVLDAVIRDAAVIDAEGEVGTKVGRIGVEDDVSGLEKGRSIVDVSAGFKPAILRSRQNRPSSCRVQH